MPYQPDTQSRLYGRRKGKPLRIRKSTLMQELLPQLTFDLPPAGMLDFAALFPFQPSSVWLEIGFGAGEHLAAQAEKHPRIAMTGCEFFVNGIAGLLDQIDRRQLQNIRIFPSDARRLLQALPPESLDRAYILFADPWPKNRHAARRFVQAETLAMLAHAMHPGAALFLATDDPVLQNWTAMQLAASKDFTGTSGPERPADWIPTRYEEKALQAGRTPLYFHYRRGGAGNTPT